MFSASMFLPFTAIVLMEDNWIIYKGEFIGFDEKGEKSPDDVLKLVQPSFPHEIYFHLVLWSTSMGFINDIGIHSLPMLAW